MKIFNSFSESVGNTPLIRLNKVSEETGCEILGKAEFLNPGGSVKDRAAIAIINDAEKKKALEPNGIIVEGTAGNTGIGLTLAANSKGHKSVIVMPKTQTEEKKQYLKNIGAELVLVDAKPYSDPGNFVRYAETLTNELKEQKDCSVVWANQFDNVVNYQCHEGTTAQEIYLELNGKIDGFICACGTGGTLTGVSLGLKQKNPNVKIGICDPMGANLFSYYTKGTLEHTGTSITEGIGQARITKNLEPLEVDFAYQINDTDALNTLYDLITYEGLYMGLSCGVNVNGAKKLAQELGPGHTIVTILCDTAHKYATKMFNKEFLISQNLPLPIWMHGDC